jgi:hypothetical protein
MVFLIDGMREKQMKKVIIGCMMMVATRSIGLAQTNFHTNVTNLWYQGYKSNVLEIANARLTVNSNDIAGLILQAEYHFEFLEVGAISNAYLRVIQVGDTITTTNFVKEWQERKSREDILDLLDVIAENPLTPQQIQADKLKALINEKPLPNADLIEALQKDDYFD